MSKIRVLLANHPMMVPEAIRQLVEAQEDMELVGDCRGPMKILQEVGRTKADAVILAQEDTGELGLCSQLLAVYPDLTIISVVPGTRTAFTQQLCSHRKASTSSDSGAIIQLIRETVQSPCREQ